MKRKIIKMVILDEFAPLKKEQIAELKNIYSSGGSRFKSSKILSKESLK
jgi:hypothetical protein